MKLLTLLAEFPLTAIIGLLSFFFKTPPAKWQTGTKGKVLLLPGQFGTWFYLRNLGDFLNNLGYQIETVPSLEPNIKSIQFGTSEVKKKLLKLPKKSVSIIAHSKAGLIARQLLTNPEVASKIKNVITVSVPHKGTYWGYFYLFNAYELLPKSSLIKNLEKLPAKNFTNIYSKFDPIVLPQKSLVLQGIKNIQINTFGHATIFNHKETLDVIEKSLNTD